LRTVRVKICGITSEKDLSIAVEAGADAVGFVVDVPSSPRNLSIKRAEELMKLVPIFTKRVAVTVPNNSRALKTMCKQLKPDAIQVHGELIRNVQAFRKSLPNIRLIRGLHVRGEISKVDLESLKLFDGLLLDSYVKGKYGGTGVIHNWELSKRVRELIDPIPLILAGGLTPDNIKKAIRVVQPYAVDVSSGVETSLGVKDPKKIVEFIENVKTVRV
jgi:phosphoribosylanthranilate isomerase